MKLWGIYYTHPDTSRRQYMNVGFESLGSAQRELDTILREREEWHSKNDINDYPLEKCLSYLIGTDWEIKPINLSPK